MDFVGMVRPITLMLRKDQPFKWTNKEREAFEKIKGAISSALVQVNLDLSKYFIMYVYSSEYNITMVLTQKDYKGKVNIL